MIKLIEDILNSSQIVELRKIISEAQFVDGRISNPHNKTKNNLHLHDANAYQQTSKILAEALLSHEDFQNFAMPKQLAPPLVTRYEPGMQYGLHPDAAIMHIGNSTLRSDLSCTIFLNEPENYEGGALRVTFGNGDMRFKGPLGSAVVYPSTTLHEVEKVESGERVVGLTFIQSQIADTPKRELLYELNEVAALEGLNMSSENFTRIQAVQQNLMRRWADN